jgi:hypothetical protein
MWNTGHSVVLESAVWENAHDPDFTTKAEMIKDRWRAATGKVSAADAAG